MPIDAPPTSCATTDSDFGKVLNSIQGLQQRLDDLSIDEISGAEAKASAVIQRLHDCQRRLAALTRLTEAVSGTTAQLSSIPDEDMDLIAADGLEKYSQLRAIVQVGKLIRMRRSLREAQANTDSSFLDAVAPAEEKPSSSGASNSSGVGSGSNPPTTEAVTLSRIPEDPKIADTPVFDQRLLSDLIQTYGEFTNTGMPTQPIDSATMIPPEVLELPKLGNDSTSLHATRPEPAFVRSQTGTVLGLPAPQETSEPAPPRSLPKSKRQGEIDRQLKSIIKDYGEYDLYSPQKSADFKLAALAAFVVLGLLIGGFYLW